MNTFFHIGLPRTATTSLQSYIFSNQELFEPICFPGNFKNHTDTSRLSANKFWRNHGLGKANFVYFDEESCLTLKEIMHDLYARAEKNNKRLLISDEGLTGKYTRLNDQPTYAKLIKNIAINPKIIMTIRKQDDFLISRYRQLKPSKLWISLGMPTKKNRTMPPPHNIIHLPQMRKMLSFNSWLNFGLETYYHHNFSNLCFFKLYRSYAAVLRPENVHVLVYEDLKNFPQRFSASISQLLNLSPDWTFQQLSQPYKNKSSDNPRKRFKKLARHDGLGPLNTIRLFYHRLIRKGGFNPILTRKQKDHIKAVYGHENTALDKELNLGLADHGYLMS